MQRILRVSPFLVSFVKHHLLSSLIKSSIIFFRVNQNVYFRKNSQSRSSNAERNTFETEENVRSVCLCVFSVIDLTKGGKMR